MHLRKSPRLVFGAIAAASGLILYGVLYHTTLWNPYAIWVAAWSAITLALYAYDKAQSLLGGLRVPKAVLHGVAIAGGFLGGWAGMLLFRHKVNQPDFVLVLLISTLGHAALVGYWFVM